MDEKGYKTETSNILSVLDELEIPYQLRGRHARLVEHDSLSIQLTGKYKDTWTRWSTGEYGWGAKELIQYLVQIGTLDYNDIKDTDFKGIKKIRVKKEVPFDYDTMVTDPVPIRAKHYLINERKLSPQVVDRMFELGKIVQDGRGNIRFLWESGEGNFTGGDVQGTHYSDKFERGYLKHALSGSKGLFFVKDISLDKVSDAKHVYVFEAPIDLLSYLELSMYSEEERRLYPEVLPILEEGWVAFSLSGADSKIIPGLQCMQESFGINLNNVTLHVATDNDEHGERVYYRLVEGEYRVERVLPNNGTPHISNQNLPIKDWNDLLKIIK